MLVHGRRARLLPVLFAMTARATISTGEMTTALIPRFSEASHKGGHGKVLVIGGSFEYTGAPYYAGISALKTGADLAYIACTEEAAIPIKSYSPELIVHPVLRTSRRVDELLEKAATRRASGGGGIAAACVVSAAGDASRCKEEDEISERAAIERQVVDESLALLRPLISRADSVVIGPGLGRDAVTLRTVARVIADIAQQHGRIITAARAAARAAAGGDAAASASTDTAAASSDASPHGSDAPRAAGGESLTPLVLDGDALYLLACVPELLTRAPANRIVLTPNKVEFSRLMAAVAGGGERSASAAGAAAAGTAVGSSNRAAQGPGRPSDWPAGLVADVQSYLASRPGGTSDAASCRPLRASAADSSEAFAQALQLSHALRGSVVLQKGPTDIIAVASLASDAAAGPPAAVCWTAVSSPSAPRRCGGQGDVTAGALGTLAAWAGRKKLLQPAIAVDAPVPVGAGALPFEDIAARALAAAADGASKLTRTAASLSFKKHYRSSTTPDIIACIGSAFVEAFGRDDDDAEVDSH